MTFDVQKFKEVIEILHPYWKYIIFIAYMIGFLVVNKIFVTDPILRKWLIASLEETPGKSSGKSITAFIFSKLIVISTLAAILYAPGHLLPDYFLISLLTFVGGLYGIKVASKYFTPDNGGPPPPGSDPNEIINGPAPAAPINNPIVPVNPEGDDPEKDKEGAGA
jgi:hypothetical protein